MTYKSADNCTYAEMCQRHLHEISRAIRLDLDPDYIDAARKNYKAFVEKSVSMTKDETIAEFEARERNAQ